MIVFTDFTCPFCRALHATLRQLEGRYPGEIAVVYRHNFGGANVVGYRAAVASDCAADQGRFAAFADLAFARQDSLGRTDWEALAAAASVPDTTALRICRDAPATRDAVLADLLEGKRVGFTGTPAIVYAGEYMLGAAPLDTLEHWLGLERPGTSSGAPR